MHRPDFERIAALIADCSRLQEGDLVVILVHEEGFELADALIVECYRRGTVPIAVIRREGAEIQVFHEVAATNVARPAEHLVAMIERADVIIPLYCQYQNPALLASVAPGKIAAHMRSRVPLQKALYDRQRRVVITDSPTPAQAAFYDVPFEEYYEAFWRAMEIDYKALGRRIAELASFMEGRREVHLSSSHGTDLLLRIDGRGVFADDGRVGMPDEKGHDTVLNLPSGEICLAPREDGADGVVVFDFAFVGGRRITDLKVSFEKGRARLVSAAEGFDRAVDFFASGTGDPYVIAELGIGANPSLTRPFGSILMDEKIAGTVHLALGDNRTMGGTNESSIHQDMIILAPRVTCDEELLMADGELKI